MAVGPNRGVKNEINVTPLVDVVLVLLIIFMVVTPMLQRGKAVTLPKAQTTTKKTPGEPDPLILSVTPDKKVFVEHDPYDLAGLEERLRSELTNTPGRKIMLKGDQGLAFGDVRKVLDVARKAGAGGIEIAVEELKGSK
jgi:biopolymer transport protein ExbD